MRILRTQLEALVLGALFLAKLVLVLATADRGFDIGDEGFFLLSLNRAAEAFPGFEFYRLLTLVEPPLEIGVVAARLLRIATELSSVAALAAGVCFWLRRGGFAGSPPTFPAFLAFALLASFLSAASRSFSYNDLSNFCTFGATALLFVVASGAGSGLPAAVGMGFLTGFQVFVKFPPALVLALFFSLYLGLGLTSRPPQQRLRLLLAFALGLSLVIPLFAAANGGLGGLVDRFHAAAEIKELRDYDVLQILRNYLFYDLLSHGNFLLLLLAFFSALGLWRLAGRLLRSRLSLPPDFATAAALATAASVLLLSVRRFHPEFVHPSLLYLFCTLPFLALLLAVVSFRDPGEGSSPLRRFETVALLALLFLLPLLNVLGSNVALTLKLPAHIAPLFILVGLLSHHLRERGHGLLRACALFILVGVTTVVFVQHQLLKPYGLPASIAAQRHESAVLPGVKLDHATERFLDELSETMSRAGFRPGDPLVAIDYMPGLVYFLGGYPPGSHFLMFGQPAFNCAVINRAQLEAPPFLLLGEAMSEEQRRCLESFAYPEDYEQVGRLSNPYAQVYSYFFGWRDLPWVSVYAPSR